ncbi:hypothetical protein [Chitinophaga ginsengisoli]|uniref:Uncharacterized protein n=1 Tax=Chitinophaga ginsengisoli TaxID=363837 RepID=A0A2P8G4U9_9BACT|nr:hypothetical protein [Chitinophaga ginsengisoli]PSL28999.1 hypothetical protein CLV42_107145 [Chitinophaga ginsengisoli]
MSEATKESVATIPSDWITTKALKTVSGAALCCWMTTIFFDLIFFKTIANRELAALLVLLVSTMSCLALALYKVFSMRGKRTKALWILIIPNAMLIYVHALGFQVATKELATRAYAEQKQMVVAQVKEAGFSALFYFLTQQTPWMPDYRLTKQVEKVTVQNDSLQANNAALRKSLQLHQIRDTMAAAKSLSVLESAPVHSVGVDSINYFRQHIRKLVLENSHLKAGKFTQDSLLSIAKAEYEQCLIRRDKNSRTDATLARRIEEKNGLIKQWNLIMAHQPMVRADIERQMNGHTGDASFYKKLFQPMPTQVQ